LIRVAIWILCADAIFAFWVIEPMFRGNSFYLYWTDFTAFIGVGGIWLYSYLGQLRQRPLMPLRDPRIAEVVPEAIA